MPVVDYHVLTILAVLCQHGSRSRNKILFIMQLKLQSPFNPNNHQPSMVLNNLTYIYIYIYTITHHLLISAYTLTSGGGSIQILYLSKHTDSKL